MPTLSYDEFMEVNGILKRTTLAMYHLKYYLLQRSVLFMSFFVKVMGNPDKCHFVTSLLHELTVGYNNLYEKVVSNVTGSLEKRMKAGKIMIQNFETSRIILQDEYRIRFASLQCVSEFLLNVENESFGDNPYEEINIIFGNLDSFIYKYFWEWLHKKKGMHVSNFIKERESDVNYPYTAPMLDKVYDITGYLCGARLYNMITLNRLKKDYRYVFNEYYQTCRYPNGSMDYQLLIYFSVSIPKVFILQGPKTLT